MYDVTVIGAGWAGFTAAREAAARGKKVCIVEKHLLGGTCLNAGCIPTKLLVQSARLLSKSRKAANFGISGCAPSADINAVMLRKQKVVANLRRGMETLLKGIDFIPEAAEIAGEGKVGAGGGTIESRAIIICSGSEPRPLEGFPFDGKKILSSDDALALDRVPQSLLVIGGGIIGCEFASIFSAFGSKVTVAEMCGQLIPGSDKDMARRLETAFRKQGITVKTGVDSSTLDVSAYECVLVSVGRKPRTAGAEHEGITMEKGRISVDGKLRTTLPGVFAAGDCTGKLMLAHYAALQGKVAAVNACGGSAEMPSFAIPACVFTSPEIAMVGINEEDAMRRGITVKEYQFDFLGSGMAQVMGEAQGLLKILAEQGTDKVVGAFVIGPNAAELGGTLTLAVQHGMTARQLKETVFAHPSLSESIGEALGKEVL